MINCRFRINSEDGAGTELEPISASGSSWGTCQPSLTPRVGFFFFFYKWYLDCKVAAPRSLSALLAQPPSYRSQCEIDQGGLEAWFLPLVVFLIERKNCVCVGGCIFRDSGMASDEWVLGSPAE